MSVKGRSLLVALVVVGTLLSVACAPQTRPEQAVPGKEKIVQEGGQPKYGGVLRTPQSLVAPSFDLISEGTNGTWLAAVPVYNGLLQYDVINHDGVPTKIIPDLAERWEVSKDGLIYSFHLRKGAKFHDGVEFTSADAKFSLERIMDPPPKTPSLRGGWYKGFITRMETPDKYTLVVHLKEPYVAFTKLIATTVTPMVPKHILEPHNARITDINLLIGTGPFKIVEGDRNVGYKLVKNEDYYRKDRPFVDEMDMPVILEETLRVAGFKTGQLDSLLDAGVSQPQLQALKREMGAKIIVEEVVTAPSGATPFWFNQRKKPFDNVRVRRAVLLAMDRPAMVKIAWEGVGCVAAYYAPSGEWGRPCEYWAKQPGFRSSTTEDLAEAKRLLAEAGYPNGFDVTLNNGYGAATDAANLLLLPMLEKIGIRATIRTLERTAYYSAMNNGDFDMTPIGLGLNVDDPNDFVGTQYITGAGRNYGAFSDPVVDDLFAKQSREMDPRKRKELARQLEDRLVEMLPSIPLQWGVEFDIRRSYVRGHKIVSGRLQEQRREHVWLDK